MRRAPGSEGDPSDAKVTKFHASVRIPAVRNRMSYKNSEEGTQYERL
ncbi:hypothetical protein T08_5289 [Trichinella sp. T8]|nr:hypothetical protein T08_5289 [Trichinella sp. T8]